MKHSTFLIIGGIALAGVAYWLWRKYAASQNTTLRQDSQLAAVPTAATTFPVNLQLAGGANPASGGGFSGGSVTNSVTLYTGQ